MKRIIYSRPFWVLASALVSLLIFLLLGYAGVILKLINLLLMITGNDHWQGESRTPYAFNAGGVIAIFIFGLVLFVSRRLIFRNRFNSRKR